MTGIKDLLVFFSSFCGTSTNHFLNVIHILCSSNVSLSSSSSHIFLSPWISINNQLRGCSSRKWLFHVESGEFVLITRGNRRDEEENETNTRKRTRRNTLRLRWSRNIVMRRVIAPDGFMSAEINIIPCVGASKRATVPQQTATTPDFRDSRGKIKQPRYWIHRVEEHLNLALLENKWEEEKEDDEELGSCCGMKNWWRREKGNFWKLVTFTSSQVQPTFYVNFDKGEFGAPSQVDEWRWAGRI